MGRPPLVEPPIQPGIAVDPLGEPAEIPEELRERAGETVDQDGMAVVTDADVARWTADNLADLFEWTGVMLARTVRDESRQERIRDLWLVPASELDPIARVLARIVPRAWVRSPRFGMVAIAAATLQLARVVRRRADETRRIQREETHGHAAAPAGGRERVPPAPPPPGRPEAGGTPGNPDGFEGAGLGLSGVG